MKVSFVNLVFKDFAHRSEFTAFIKEHGILCVFHYLSLHASPRKHGGRVLPESDRYSDCLVRLPMYYDLPIEKVIEAIGDFMVSPCRHSRTQLSRRKPSQQLTGKPHIFSASKLSIRLITPILQT